MLPTSSKYDPWHWCWWHIDISINVTHWISSSMRSLYLTTFPLNHSASVSSDFYMNSTRKRNYDPPYNFHQLFRSRSIHICPICFPYIFLHLLWIQISLSYHCVDSKITLNVMKIISFGPILWAQIYNCYESNEQKLFMLMNLLDSSERALVLLKGCRFQCIAIYLKSKFKSFKLIRRINKFHAFHLSLIRI